MGSIDASAFPIPLNHVPPTLLFIPCDQNVQLTPLLSLASLAAHCAGALGDTTTTTDGIGHATDNGRQPPRAGTQEEALALERLFAFLAQQLQVSKPSDPSRTIAITS